MILPILDNPFVLIHDHQSVVNKLFTYLLSLGWPVCRAYYVVLLFCMYLLGKMSLRKYVCLKVTLCGHFLLYFRLFNTVDS